MTLDEQLIHSTIKINSIQSDGSECSGTGFFFNFEIDGKRIPAIITNKHVVRESKKLLLSFSLVKNNEILIGQTQKVCLTDPASFIVNHPNKDVDLCAILIGAILNSEFENQLLFSYFSIENIITDADFGKGSLSNIEEITLIGYPDGLFDEYNNLPIVRRGITATSIKYDFDNKKEFLIDSAIFPGSSGSPVIIFNQGAYSHHNGIQFGNRLYLIGIVSKTFLHKIDGELKAIEVPSTSKIIAQSMMPNNLGIVIKSERILELIPEIRSLCQNLKDN